jgi:thioredoxin-related protein
MKKIYAIVLSGLLGIQVVSADKGEEVYRKICAQCHKLYVPEEKLTKNFTETNNTMLKLKAPPLSMISTRMKEKIGDPDADDDIHRLEVNAFIADYIIYPDKKKSVLGRMVGESFETMPSLKGKLSTEDIEAISNYVYDLDEKIKREKKVDYVTFEKALKKAKKEDKIILVKATAPHCRYCVKMEKICRDPDIVKILNQSFVVVPVDLSQETLPLDLHVSMTPTFFFLFVNKENDKVKIKRIPGAWNQEDFIDILKEAVEAKNKKKVPTKKE